MGLFRKTLNSCFGIFWEIAGKKSHMGKNFLRLWTKRENYNENFWENMGLFRKTMKSRFGIFWEKLGKYSHNGKIFLFSGKQNPTIWENMGISWTRFRSKFARFWEILGKCRKIWGYFGKIRDYFFPKKLLFLTVMLGEELYQRNYEIMVVDFVGKEWFFVTGNCPVLRDSNVSWCFCTCSLQMGFILCGRAFRESIKPYGRCHAIDIFHIS